MTRHLSLLGVSSLLFSLLACGGSTESELGSTSNSSGSSGSPSAGTGGANAGGANAGGANAGGANAGGANAGGANAGGANAGGANAGGASAGTNTGGTNTGGTNTGGTNTGGTSGGSAGAPQPDCAPPSDPTRAAVCVSFAPEAMDFIADDPQLDGVGLLYLAAYDTPTPDGPNGEVEPIAALVYPPQSGAGETGPLSGAGTLRLDGLPSQVYLRALFFDNAEAFKQNQVGWGVWVGGMDVSQGLTENMPLDPQSFSPGKGTPFTMPLTALRRLEVEVKLAASAAPADNAEGPFQWFSFNQQTLAENMPLFGTTPSQCLSFAGGASAVVRGFSVGSGERFVVGVLNDFNQLPGLKGGEILNVAASAGGLQAVGSVNFGPTEYRKTHAIDLSLVIPLNGPAPASYSCPLMTCNERAVHSR